ncbi:hypothetical protein [Prosthecomicrobium sp. N25]|uniref:hypothetical protein n=1 Tax=Prosthecomicrobium sp. N25 TaxID=3129254 RepID=UPI003077046D
MRKTIKPFVVEIKSSRRSAKGPTWGLLDLPAEEPARVSHEAADVFAPKPQKAKGSDAGAPSRPAPRILPDLGPRPVEAVEADPDPVAAEPRLAARKPVRRSPKPVPVPAAAPPRREAPRPEPVIERAPVVVASTPAEEPSRNRSFVRSSGLSRADKWRRRLPAVLR